MLSPFFFPQAGSIVRRGRDAVEPGMPSLSWIFCLDVLYGVFGLDFESGFAGEGLYEDLHFAVGKKSACCGLKVVFPIKARCFAEIDWQGALICFFRKTKKKLVFPMGIDPMTSCVLNKRDNHYTTET